MSEKVTETLDVISTGDIDSEWPSVYLTSVRQSLHTLNKTDTHDYILAISLGIAAFI